MRIRVDFEEVEMTNDYGGSTAGVVARCSKCGHETESFGTGEGSQKRCLAVMNEECPEGLNAFYVGEL